MPPRRNGEPKSTAFREHLSLFYVEGARKLIGAGAAIAPCAIATNTLIEAN
ncbi:hypothetical protein QUB63_32450 [Microcoleus sp. ARI1-B5]|uniref:hypothetical protein n=1 Tax=unclassified Microcoleus TaxID=2642155 RepID=UPI002FD79F0F